MDFTPSDAQREIRDLADQILGDHCAPEVLRKLERGHTPFAAAAWEALAGADLVGLAVPEGHGGSGLGLLEAAAVAEQVGRHVAPVPYWTAAAAAAAVSRWASDEVREKVLPGALDGSAPLGLALWQPLPAPDGLPTSLTATPTPDGLRLDGERSPVPWAGAGARRAVVSAGAAADGAPVLALVDLDLAGVTRTDEASMTGEPVQTLGFDGVTVPASAVLGADRPGTEVLHWTGQRATALQLATVLGVCEEALAITGRYVAERQQFGTPIGTFQAVAHRCADAYIDVEALRLTCLQAWWRLDAGAAGGDEALDVARFWACETGHRVVHAAQHLHGGIGMDTDYPIHRYFRWARAAELLLGGAGAAARSLGAALAAEDRAAEGSTADGTAQTTAVVKTDTGGTLR